MTIEWIGERHLRCVPELRFRHDGNAIQVGTFPKQFVAKVFQTERGLWTLCMYQGDLHRRSWRQGDSLPREAPEEPLAAIVQMMRCK